MMKVVLKPSVTFETESEKRNFLECLGVIQEACNSMPDCDGCPWGYFCKQHLTDEDMADFITNFQKMLLDYEIEEEEGW